MAKTDGTKIKIPTADEVKTMIKKSTESGLNLLTSFSQKMPDIISSDDQILLKTQIDKAISENKIDPLLLMKVRLIGNLSHRNQIKLKNHKINSATSTDIIKQFLLAHSHKDSTSVTPSPTPAVSADIFHNIINADSSKEVLGIMKSLSVIKK